MSVGSCLELDDVTTGRLAQAAVHWPRWQITEPALMAFGGLDELRAWLRTADSLTSDTVLAPLARLASARHDSDDAVLAAAALAWVLIPGATCLARRLAGGKVADVDQAVATQLWIEVRSSEHLLRKVATNILLNTRAGLLEDLGLRQGRRQMPMLFDPLDWERCDLLPAAPPLRHPEQSAQELAELLEWAHTGRVISAEEQALLVSLVVAVDEVGATRTKGKSRGAIFGDRVTAHVAAQWGIGAATVKRRAGRSIDALVLASSRYAS